MSFEKKMLFTLLVLGIIERCVTCYILNINKRAQKHLPIYLLSKYTY